MSDTCPSIECCDPIYTHSADSECDPLLDLILVPYPPEGGTTSGSGKYAAGTNVVIDQTTELVAAESVGVDLVIVVDESGTMIQSWPYIPQLISQLDTQLRASGIGSGVVHNRYGLIGQGMFKQVDSHYSTMTIAGEGVDYYMGGTDQWTDIDPDDPTTGLNKIVAATAYLGIQTLPGPGVACEDAYSGIDRAITNRTWRDGVARVILFLTDEDRNYPTYSAQGVLQDYYVYPDFDWAAQRTRLTAEIATWGGTIHGAVNVRMNDSLAASIIGQDSSGITYKADGAGGFTNGIGGVYVGESGGNSGNDGNGNPYLPSTSKQDYYDFLIAIPKSTVWDYQKFNVGGPNQASFTASLVDYIQADIVSQVSWVFDGWFYTNGDPFLPNPTVSPQTVTLNDRLVLAAHFHKE